MSVFCLIHNKNTQACKHRHMYLSLPSIKQCRMLMFFKDIPISRLINPNVAQKNGTFLILNAQTVLQNTASTALHFSRFLRYRLTWENGHNQDHWALHHQGSLSGLYKCIYAPWKSSSLCYYHGSEWGLAKRHFKTGRF